MEERYKFLSDQLEDVKATRRDLLTVVRDVDERILEVFSSAYHDVAREFVPWAVERGAVVVDESGTWRMDPKVPLVDAAMFGCAVQTGVGAAINTAELQEASEAYAEQVSQAVASDAETSAYVEELEQRSDDMAQQDISGETLAAELTRFLRDRERGNGGGPKPPDDLPREQ